MAISEMTEEKSEESNDHYQDDYECFVDPGAQKERIRRIIEYQKSVYRPSSTSVFLLLVTAEPEQPSQRS